MSDRGQAFTLEAFVAAILLVATVAFALQAVSISANTAGVSESELRGQHAGLAEGLLNRAAEQGTLTTALVYWNESTGEFHGADDEGYYVSSSQNTSFGESMEATLDDAKIRYNVDLYYRDEDGEWQMQRLVESGTPTDDAVRAVETVTLYDDTHLVDEDGEPHENTTLEAVSEDFYAPNVDEERSLYNVVRVEVVVWRT